MEELIEEEAETSLDPHAIQFPLPEHLDLSKCRDEFLRTIFEEEDQRVSRESPRWTIEGILETGKPLEVEDPTIEKEAEAMVVRQLAKHRNRVSQTRTVEEIMASFRMHSALLEELNIECQKAAIEFLSVRLLKQLRLFSSPWPGKLEDMPYQLFSWSVEHFMARLGQDQTYLDVFSRERTAADLDCLKFRADLNEIELIIYDIRKDFKLNDNLCEKSIKYLQGCKYITDTSWVKDLEDNRRIRDKLESHSLADEPSIFDLENRKTLLMDRFEDVSAIDPIEMRYLINWINSCTDQRLMLLNDSEEALKKELQDLETKLSQDMMVHRNSEMVYSMEVERLKISLNEWQKKMDNDLENAEVMCTVTKYALQKVKDDHKMYMEQEVMFRQRIAEVKELMASEEKNSQAKRGQTN
ncbi:uncharacterized protein LOC108096101 [Drosophila ficusphila]|uniref:uncharacterized protein LOC108096101 n=1 Tax=Drosophila ficusphila TaxID=30025 RepID=UPI001C89D511|nr:uncharacterized protein LOC108096101 [Drosophila ficusphila]